MHLKCITDTNIQTNMSNSSPSICIPRVFAEISRKQIKDTFSKVLSNEDCIERIDMIRKNKNNDSYQRVFIHFKYWPNDERSTMLKNRLTNGQDIKVVYNQPWFWKCSASRVPKPNRR